MTLPGVVTELTNSFLDEVDRRLPGRLTGLFLHGSICWGEFFPGSDVDFVGLWDRVPTGAELGLLAEAHHATRQRLPEPTFDGFHCTPQDLSKNPSEVGQRPAFYGGAFNATGKIDINLVTWHELAERPVVVRGDVPPVYTDLPGLIEFTRENLDSYWRSTIQQLEDAGVDAVGVHDDAIAWVGLGPARLHHLLTKKSLTSKSGAGRYVVDELDARWEKIGREALRIREHPDTLSHYHDLAERGRDVHALVKWLVEDGTP